MFYPNLLNLRNSSYHTIDFSTFSKGVNNEVDDSILPINYSKVSYNYNYHDGALKDGIGIDEISIPYSKVDDRLYKNLDLPSGCVVYGAWLFNAWHDDGNVVFPLLVVFCSDGKMYFNYLHSAQTQMHEMRNLFFSEKPNVISYNLNGVDTLILVSDADGMYTWTETYGGRKIDNAPKIKSMCIHFERLFATANDYTRRVWFSDDLNPTNFNVSSEEGGYIDLIDDFGRSNKVISFNDYVYVFRDFNIARITAFAQQENFSVSQLDVGNSRIFADTVSICDNKVIYLAGDGLYSFNGSSASKINLGISNLFKGVDNQYAKAGYADGYYYLACRTDFKDDIVGCENNEFYRNNTLIKLNVSTGEFSILRGYDIREICVINDTLGSTVLCIINDGITYKFGMFSMSGSVFGEATYKVWQSPEVDLWETNKDKVITEISINNHSDCKIILSVDGKKKIYRLNGREKVNVVRPYLRGKKISIRIESNVSNVKIESPQLKVGLL